MHGKKPLCMHDGFEPPHLSFLLARRLMADFGKVVRITFGIMNGIRHNGLMGGRVATQFVGDQSSQCPSLGRRKLAKESCRCAGITPPRNENIEHIAILVDGAVEVALLTVDPDEYLIHKPVVTAGATLSLVDLPGVARPKLCTPTIDGFVGCRNAAQGDRCSLVQLFGWTDLLSELTLCRNGRSRSALVQLGWRN